MKTINVLLALVFIQAAFTVAFGFKHELLRAELNSVIEATPVKHVAIAQCRIA